MVEVVANDSYKKPTFKDAKENGYGLSEIR